MNKSFSVLVLLSSPLSIPSTFLFSFSSLRCLLYWVFFYFGGSSRAISRMYLVLCMYHLFHISKKSTICRLSRIPHSSLSLFFISLPARAMWLSRDSFTCLTRGLRFNYDSIHAVYTIKMIILFEYKLFSLPHVTLSILHFSPLRAAAAASASCGLLTVWVCTTSVCLCGSSKKGSELENEITRTMR